MAEAPRFTVVGSATLPRCLTASPVRKYAVKMTYRLRYLQHDFELSVGEFTIGRSDECQLALDDPNVNRRHAVLRVQADGVSITDLGSRNGTFVDGVKISSDNHALKGGNKIGIGSQEMTISEG
jgi:pSer/pThr/pTyr-binding forkhead associated (FHA) protein